MARGPGVTSLTQQVIDYIRKQGVCRSTDIDEKFGFEAGKASALLCMPVKRGDVVACKVERPGKPACNEYRIGSGIPPVGATLVDPDQVGHHIDPAPNPKPAERLSCNGNSPSKSCAPDPGDSEGGETDIARTAEPDATLLAAPGDMQALLDPQPAPICSIDSAGRLHLVIDGRPLVFSPAETREIGQLLVDCEPAWN